MEHVLIVGGEWVLIALVFAGAVPELAMTCQFLLTAGHGWHNHYGACEPVFPRTAVLIPAWNEGAVIAGSIDRLMAAEYPPESLRVFVVDDSAWEELQELLSRPPALPPAMVKLLSNPSVLERPV